jgi:ATP-dependent Clp protease ATP-binding subunit ClpC
MDAAERAGADRELPRWATEPARTPLLDSLSTDLTRRAFEGRLPAVVGREAELERVVAVLSKSRKNNVVLVGPPGTGKSAIAELLARRIAEAAVPGVLQDCRVVAVEVSALAAGAGVRGTFEDRVRGLVAEVEASEGGVILFFDEIHTLLGAGNAEGGLDGGHILKPALARGRIRCLGATTEEEYRRIFEKDGALARRFQLVRVAEPTPEETERILAGLRPELEATHGVSIPPRLCGRAIELADRYVRDRHRPDKAIDLLDEAAADVKVGPCPSDPFAREEVRLLRAEIQQREKDGDAEEARRLRETLALYQVYPPADERVLDEADLLRTVHRWKGVSPERPEATEASRLKALRFDLGRRIVGQDRAVERIARRLVRGRLGADPQRPLASFLFLGPTGVGKTETAHEMAEVFFGQRDAVARVDLSEYRERHSVARLLGSPPGYVGYRESAPVIRRLLDRPASVVLFDEVEKAHPDVLAVLLQVLEDGRLTDGTGRTIDFTQAVVVLTSNLALEGAGDRVVGFKGTPAGPSRPGAAGPVEPDAHLRRELGRLLRPELVNRIDEVIAFEPLAEEALAAIARRALERAVGSFRERFDWRVIVAPGVPGALVAEARVESGARAVRRTVERLVGARLAEVALDGVGPTDVRIEPADGGLRFEVRRLAPS